MNITIYENQIKIPDSVRASFISAGINIKPYEELNNSCIEGTAVIYDDFSSEYIDYLIAKATDRPAIIGNTARLQIREIHISEIDQYQKLIEECGQELQNTEMLGSSQSEFAARHKAYIEYHYNFYGFGLWGLYLQSNPAKMIGLAGVSGTDHTISYCITEKYRKMGFAYEACRFVLDYMKNEFGIEDITAVIKKENAASIALAKKLGIKSCAFV